MNELQKAIEEMLSMTDEFAKCSLAEGTPIWELQQGLIANAKRYRERKNGSSER